MTVPVRVIEGASMTCARPKSINLAWPSAVNMTLPGLTSR